MLAIAMPPSEPHLAPFTSFLQAQQEYKAVNLDQWTSFQRFAEEVSLPPHSTKPERGKRVWLLKISGPGMIRA